MTDRAPEQQPEGSPSPVEPPPESDRAELDEAQQHIARLQVAGQEHEAIEHALRERIKELNCLYGISHLVERPGMSLEGILRGTAELIPPAWQYPEIAAARITLEGQEYRTENWTDDVLCRQVAPIAVRGRPSGKVEVCYLEDKPESDDGPFLHEERRLLDAIAERLGRIIERLQAERALEQERDRAQGYLDVAGVILVVIAADQTITLINKRGCEIIGYDEDEIVGQNWFECFIPRQNRDQVVATFRQLMAGDLEPIEYFENPILTRGGEERTIAWHNTVLRDPSGRITGTLSSGEDITERIQAERALRDSEERFRIVTELTSDGAYSLRIEPDGTVQVEWMTEAFARVTGLTQAEFDGMDTWIGLIHPEDLSTFERRIRAIEDRQEDASEYRIRCTDGGWRWLRDYGRPEWDETQGRVVRVHGAIQDITDRVLAEQSLRQTRDELEQRVAQRTAEIEQAHQRERVLNALLRLSIAEHSLDEQLDQALKLILSIPWLPVLPRGAIFLADGSHGELCLRAQRGLEPALQAACARVRFGQCLCGRAAARGKIEFADRVDERHAIVYEGMPPHGHYCVPILSSRVSSQAQAGVIGTIVLYLEPGHRRDSQEEAFLRAVAHTVAHMVERGRAEQALRKSEQQLRKLNRQLEMSNRTLEQRVIERTYEIERRSQVAESLRDILAVLNSDRPLNDILEQIVTEAGRLLQSDSSAIYRPREQDGRFEVQTVKGRSADRSDTTPLSLPLAQALREGRPVTFSDLSAGKPERGPPNRLRPLPSECLIQGCRSVLAVPLIITDAIYGALVLCYKQPRAFAEDELELAVAFADQAALAIENTRLHQRARDGAVVQERARLARDLHDSVTQSLYSLTLLAEGWRRLDAAGRLEDKDAPLKELGELAQQALKEMRLMVYELRPPALEQEGLLGALHQRLGAVEQRSGVEARLLAQEIVELPARIEEGLYRIAIEALNNALKHAFATTVTVHLRSDEKWVVLEVVDDGQGFSVETAHDSPGIGLHTMRERAQELGGTLLVRSSPGEGASITARVPFEQDNH